MSILASLVRAYERLPDIPPYGFSNEKIGFQISLDEQGMPVGLPHDLRLPNGKNQVAPTMLVPQPVKRASNIAPNFLWDKTAYVLGVTAGEGRRIASEHAAFVLRHMEALGDTADAGLKALRLFLEHWTPDRFVALEWPEEMKDQNVVFGLESERRSYIRIHDRPAARALWARLSAAGDKPTATCLVTGEPGPVARLHPAIKGVWGAQPSGASIVSFNLDAFTSYGREQGDNAPVSEASAFAYTTVLNRFLASGSQNRIQIGDASTVFWADASNAADAMEAEYLIAGMYVGIDEVEQAKRIGAKLKAIRLGLSLRRVAPELEDGVRLYVLGLAPNAARISIRFWLDSDFSAIAKNYQDFVSEMRVEPPPRDPYPPLGKYLAETAVRGKGENVSPNLAGEWMRSILTGTSYPLTLLSTVLVRIRADGEVNGLRVGILKALLLRNFRRTEREVPVSLDPDNSNKGYLLGRLFALYEHIQSAALGQKVNATIKDKFYGAASAQPRKVFPLLDRGSTSHLSKVGKASPGRKVNLERQLGQIMEGMSPADDPFPAALSAEEQALFGLGYYHQRNAFFKPRKDASIQEEAAAK
jgi:CRISPR-associated protein Csd1